MLSSSERAEERAAVLAAPRLRTLCSDGRSLSAVFRRNAQPIPAGKHPCAVDPGGLKSADFIVPNQQHP
jgi:hypothetical protein